MKRIPADPDAILSLIHDNIWHRRGKGYRKRIKEEIERLEHCSRQEGRFVYPGSRQINEPTLFLRLFAICRSIGAYKCFLSQNGKISLYLEENPLQLLAVICE